MLKMRRYEKGKKSHQNKVCFAFASEKFQYIFLDRCIEKMFDAIQSAELTPKILKLICNSVKAWYVF